jgi:hypothetical protein
MEDESFDFSRKRGTRDIQTDAGVRQRQRAGVKGPPPPQCQRDTGGCLLMMPAGHGWMKGG